MTTPLDFAQIPQFPRSGWEVDVAWRDLLWFLDKHLAEEGLNLSPDYQRGHVWTEEQRVRYIEYILQGGEGSRTLSFNHPGWMRRGPDGPYEILDGLQRLTSALMFLRGELRAFGRWREEFTGHLRNHIGFKWRIYTLPTRADVLKFYLDMNAGGTPHAEAEIERVRRLLQAEWK